VDPSDTATPTAATLDPATAITEARRLRRNELRRVRRAAERERQAAAPPNATNLALVAATAAANRLGVNVACAPANAAPATNEALAAATAAAIQLGDTRDSEQDAQRRAEEVWAAAMDAPLDWCSFLVPPLVLPLSLPLSLSLFLFIFLPNNVNKILARLEQGRVGAQLSVRAV